MYSLLRLEIIIRIIIITLKAESLVDDCSKKNVWTEAEKCCTYRGSSQYGLPSIQTEDEFLKLLSDMEESNRQSVWLGFTRKTLTEWEWLDSSSTTLKTQDGFCGFYNRSSEKLSAAKCSSMEHGHVCEISRCGDCALLGVPIQTCKKIADKCLIFFCEMKNWYNARAECISLDGDLTLLKKHVEKWEVSRSRSSCNSFWVGLRKEKWEYNGSDMVPVGMWANNEPSDVGDCAILKKKDNEYEINVAPCDQAFAYICIEKNVTSKTYTTQYTSLSHTRLPNMPAENVTLSSTRGGSEGSNMSSILIACGVSIAVMVIILGIFLLVIWRKQSSPIRNTHTTEENVELMNREAETDMSEPSVLKQIVAKKILQNYADIETWSWMDSTASVPFDEIYTDLVTVQVTSHISESVESRLSSYVDLLQQGPDNNDPTRVILIGDAGTGKTTLCRKIITDWAKAVISESKENSTLDRFDLILPVFLRYLSDGQSLKDILQEQLLMSDLEKELLDIHINTQSSKIMFIFDGYDEFNESKFPDVMKLAKGHESFFSIFVTARAMSFGHVFNGLRGIYTKAILKGFSEEGKHEYIDKFYAKETDKLRSGLKEKISSTDDLLNLSRYPAILLLMVVLWKDNMKLSDTFTGFYQDFVDYLCIRHNRKQNTSTEVTSKSALRDLYKENLMKAGRIAINGLKGDSIQLSFRYDYVKEILGDMALAFGLFSKDKVLKGEQYVSFYHKTVQEYFASYYMIHCEICDRKRLLRDFYSTSGALKDTNMISRFLSGLGGGEMCSRVLDIINESPKDTAEAATEFQLTFLSENPNAKFQLPACIYLRKYGNLTYETLKQYLSMEANILDELTLEISHQNEIIILSELKSKPLKMLRLIYVPEDSVWEELRDSNESVAAIIRKFPLVSLGLRYFLNGFEKSVPTICKFVDTMSSLEELDLSSTLISDNLLVHLADKMVCLKHLKKICLADVNEDCNIELDINPLLAILYILENLTVFNLSQRYLAAFKCIPDNQFSKLLEIRLGRFSFENKGGGRSFLKHMALLRDLSLFEAGKNSLAEEGLMLLGSFLSNLNRLTYLDISSCGCEKEEIWINFIPDLQYLHGLQELYIAKNKLEERAMSQLSNILLELKSLKHLDLTDCGIETEKGGRAILRIVESHTSVIKLWISGNNLSHVSSNMVPALNNNRCLKYIEVSDTRLDPDVAAYINQRSWVKI